MFKNRIEQLEEILIKDKSEIDSLNGQLVFIDKTITEKQDNVEKLKRDKESYSKASELLQLVQKVTREKTKDNFEKIVTHALKSIFDENYELQLEFGRKGNLPELNFNIKTPDCQEFVDPINSESGGIKNVVAMALRLVLLEVSVPKINGFLVFDEKFLGVSEEYRENTMNFLKEINNKLTRQIVFVSHEQHFIDNADYNIKIGE